VSVYNPTLNALEAVVVVDDACFLEPQPAASIASTSTTAAKGAIVFIRPILRPRHGREDLAPARKQKLVRSVEKVKLGSRQPPLEVEGERGRRDGVALAPQSDTGATTSASEPPAAPYASS
jgi:hypothetical protein